MLNHVCVIFYVFYTYNHIKKTIPIIFYYFILIFLYKNLQKRFNLFRKIYDFIYDFINNILYINNNNL